MPGIEGLILFHNQKEELVLEIFETIYAKYDLSNSLISFFLHKLWRKDALKKMQVQKGTRAIDLCCGTGDWTVALAREVGPRGEVFGFDFSTNMLKIAEERISKDKDSLNNIRIMHGNVKTLPFDDSYFDYATIGFGLRNVAGYLEALKEIQRVLKPGGKLACLETSKPAFFCYNKLFYLYMRYAVPFLGWVITRHYNEYLWLHKSTWNFPDKEELAQLFRDAGFMKVEINMYLGGVAVLHLGYK